MTDDPKSVATLKAYYKADIHKDDLGAFLEAMEPETDRAAIVIIAAIMEDALAYRLKSRMKPFKNTKQFDRLFEFEGPLGSFSAKIDLACALGVIEQVTRDRLQLFRHMRNACAHSMKPISLQTPALWNVFLSCARPPIHLAQALNPTDWTEPNNRRRSFRIHAAFLVQIILYGSLKNAADRMAQRYKVDLSQSPSRDTPPSRSTPKDRQRQTARAQPFQRPPSAASPRARARKRKTKP